MDRSIPRGDDSWTVTTCSGRSSSIDWGSEVTSSGRIQVDGLLKTCFCPKRHFQANRSFWHHWYGLRSELSKSQLWVKGQAQKRTHVCVRVCVRGSTTERLSGLFEALGDLHRFEVWERFWNVCSGERISDAVESRCLHTLDKKTFYFDGQ